MPAIHAVTIIGQEPEQYGFSVSPDEPLSYERITGAAGHQPQARRVALRPILPTR